MSRCGVLSLVLLLIALVVAAPAQGASMVFIKKSNVWMARADGSGQVRVTRDGSRGNPYYSPSIADNATIVALRGVFLHSFRPNGRRIVRARQWAINPSPAISTEPFFVDLSPNGRITATQNAIYSTYYDPRTSETRPTVSAWFTDFFDFRRNPPREIGLTDGFYDYNYPAWIDSRRVLSTSYGIFNAQIFTNRVGNRTRGVEFYRDPGRDPDTGTNSYILADAEMTRARNRFAVMRRPLRVDTADLSVATIQIYRAANPSTASEPLCAIGPGRRIGPEPDPSWSPDGKTLAWYENGRGIFSTRVTSAPGCGLRPRLIVRGAHSPDLSKAKVPRRRR
ncbi:MAG: PD40 domain-containing protein [Thermoleophilaceae bacterium]|nr:PD40 domain-containing protein [Thermoleophilaceae bacterium]